MPHSLFFILYTTGIRLGNLLIYIGRFFSDKIALMYLGRKKTLKRINQGVSENYHPIWIHCASLGEFEQGRPLIEAIKTAYPKEKILVSFFSPSGYEIRKNYTNADEIIYLPSDQPQNNQKLLRFYQPKMLILVKYELWWNLIKEVQSEQIPIFLISGVFRENDYFFKKWLTICRTLLSRFEMIFVQDEESVRVLNSNQIERTLLAGDTRIDRVLDSLESSNVPEKIKKFTDDQKVIIYGSVWMTDMQVVSTMIAAFPKFRHIVAPHDIRIGNINDIRKQIETSSDLYSADTIDSHVLIIDNIGMLSSLYAVADLVYIGGGFGAGIHNILEPAVFGNPVFLGPKYKKFNEAVALVEVEAAFSIRKGEEMANIAQKLMTDSMYLKSVNDRIHQYFNKNRGATQKILRHLAPIIDNSNE